MYDFVPLDKNLLEKTSDNWKKCLNEEDPPFSPDGYDAFLAYCQNILNDPASHRDARPYAIVRSGDEFAAGIMILTLALPGLPGAWIKVTSSRTSPRLDSRWGNDGMAIQDRLRKVAAIITTGFLEIYRLSDTDLKCNKIKFYANKQVDRSLFMKFVEVIDSNPEMDCDKGDLQIELESQGAWLILQKTREGI